MTRLKPEDITKENSNEAIDQVLSDLNKLSTMARRQVEVATAWSNQSGNSTAHITVVRQAERALAELDNSIADYLALRNNKDA